MNLPKNASSCSMSFASLWFVFDFCVVHYTIYCYIGLRCHQHQWRNPNYMCKYITRVHYELWPLLLTLIPVWISIHMQYKVWNKITNRFPNFNGAAVEVWVWKSNFIPHFFWAYDYLSTLRFKLVRLNKKGHWSYDWNETQHNHIIITIIIVC